MEKRIHDRCEALISVNYRPLTTNGHPIKKEGTLLNFSSSGVFIRSLNRFEIGTILLIRIGDFPSDFEETSDNRGLRSIGLAEVKWVQPLTNNGWSGFGMGLRYLR